MPLATITSGSAAITASTLMVGANCVSCANTLVAPHRRITAEIK